MPRTLVRKPPALNSRSYWESRFATSWEADGGFEQTRFFARVAVENLPSWLYGEILTNQFTVCDWGCAAGDGVAVLHQQLGVPVEGYDFAKRAIALAQQRYPQFRFTCASADAVADTFDVVFATNTLEHFRNPFQVLESLMGLARHFVVAMVPFREDPRCPEHEFTFDEDLVPARLGEFALVATRLIDTSRLPQTFWAGQQLLMVWANLAHPDLAAVRPLTRPLGNGDGDGVTLAQAKDQVAATDRWLERRSVQRMYERIRAMEEGMERVLPELANFRGSRAYRLGQISNSFKVDPVGASLTLGLWATGFFRRRNSGLVGALHAVDPMAKVADLLRAHADPTGQSILPEPPAQLAEGAMLLASAVRPVLQSKAGLVARRLLPAPVDRYAGRLLEMASPGATAAHSEAAREAEYLRAKHNIADACSSRAPAKHQAELRSILKQASKAKGVVVYLPTVNWGYLFQRPQQLMRQLAKKGYLCLFCSAIPEQDGVDGFREVEPNLYLCSDVRLTFALQRPVLWMNWPVNRVYLPFYKAPKVVYEFIDELDVFHLYCRLMDEDHEALVRDADVVVATADRLARRISAVREGVVLAPNGVEPEDFAGDHEEDEAPDDLLPALARGKPIVGYYGALAKWLDYDLFNATTRAAPDLTFVLIGPDYDGSRRLVERRENVFVLDQKKYTELPRYSRRFDVATIPFQINDITKSTSPVKLFEYMAAGAPIVTTAMDECAKYSSVMIARSRGEYLELLRKAVGLRRDAAYQELLAHEVTENTWAKRVDDILAAMKKRRADQVKRLERE